MATSPRLFRRRRSDRRRGTGTSERGADPGEEGQRSQRQEPPGAGITLRIGISDLLCEKVVAGSPAGIIRVAQHRGGDLIGEGTE